MLTLGHVVRRLSRTGGGSLLVLGSLGIAIGAAGALLSIYNALAIRTMNVSDPDRLVSIAPMNGNAIYGIPMATLAALRTQPTSFSELCGLSASTTTVQINGKDSKVVTESVTGTCYPMLGVQPFLGRLIDDRDAPLTGAAAPVAVVSHTFWSTALASDPQVVGRKLVVKGVPLTVIGVTAPGVGGFYADQAPAVVLPLGAFNNPAPIALYAVGRLKDGVTLATATAELRGLWPSLWASTNPLASGQRPSRAGTLDALKIASVGRGISRMRDTYSDPVAFLLCLAIALVLLACVNVGGFLLARVTTRDRELAVMTALGASLADLGLDVAAEGAALAIGAGLLAMPIAWATSRLFATLTWTGTLPTTLRTTPDAWVLAAIGGVAAFAGLVISGPSIVFAVVGGRPLAGFARGTTRTSGRWRKGLVVAQVCLAMVLAFASALFARNLSLLRQSDPGYDPRGVLFAKLELQANQPRVIDQAAYYRPLFDQLSAIPGVKHVGLAMIFPSSQLYQVVGLTPIHQADVAPGVADVSGDYDYVSPGFAATVGAQLLAGREFEWTDDASHDRVTMINRALADKLFPNGSPIGARVQLGSQKPATVIGVVSDVSPGDYRLRDLPLAYLPFLQVDGPFINTAEFIVRTSDEALPLEPLLRQTVEAAGRQRLLAMNTIPAQMELFWLRERSLSAIALTFGALSALIGALGLFALLEHNVSARRQELGVRLALGASGPRLARAVMAEGAVLIAIGAALGVPASFAAGRAARAFLTGLSPYDTASLGVALAGLVALVLVASVRPGLRAARTRPSDALRAE